MEIIYIAVILTVIAFLAHIIKGLTGFGPAIVFVSVGSFIYDPITIIVLASLLDIIGGAYLSFLNPDFFQKQKYWLPIGVMMLIGAIIGAITLHLFPPELFEILLGGAIIVIAVWFILGNSEPSAENTQNHSINITDGSVGLFSGFCGGFTGMGGPPLIIYLGSKLQKNLFRAVIVPIFLMASIARFSSYGVLGMINFSQVSLYILPPLGVILGNFVGDKFFDSIEQKWFTIIIGIILLASGLRLLFA